jgi:hypothetical protein
MGQAGLPELADDPQALVDEVVVDLDLTDLVRADKELGDEQVLALRSDLDDPVRWRHRQAGVPHQPQQVVLVLHQPALRVERFLVLQLAIEHPATELVSAVRAQVGGRVQLGEQVGLRVALDRDPQGVEPPEPARLNGLIATGTTPSCSSSAWAMASCRAPVTSRCAVQPRR